MKDVINFEGFYKVTEDGDIYSVRGERFLKKSLKPNGYEYIELNVKKEVSYKRVHRLVAEAWVSNPDNKPFVNHIDGNKSNNCASNLDWVTGTENNLHAIEHGLVKFYHNVYEVTSPKGETKRCVGHFEVMEFSGVSKTTITSCVKYNRLSRSGYRIEFKERVTTSPRGRTPKQVETGGNSQSS